MKAVIFDMDGVLFDTERLAIKAWDKIGIDIGLGKIGYMVFETLGRTTEESVKIFKSKFGNKFNNDIFQRHYKDYLNNYYSNNPVPVKKGVYETLEYLKNNGYKTAIASSSSKKSVIHHLNNANITDFFDIIICGDMVERSKPEPDIYLTAASELNVPPEYCFAVEDSFSGLKSAYTARCKVIYIPDIYVADEQAKKYIELEFETLNNFTEYLKLAD